MAIRGVYHLMLPSYIFMLLLFGGGGYIGWIQACSLRSSDNAEIRVFDHHTRRSVICSDSSNSFFTLIDSLLVMGKAGSSAQILNAAVSRGFDVN
jgi:hypothetical protein